MESRNGGATLRICLILKVVPLVHANLHSEGKRYLINTAATLESKNVCCGDADLEAED